MCEYHGEKLVTSIIGKYHETLNLYDKYVEKLSRVDQEINDIEHVIELGKVSASDRQAIYNELKEALVKRREIKDELQVLQPLYAYMKNNSHIFEKLSKVQSGIEKTKNFHSNRNYTPRIKENLVKKYIS